jgi:hypothetical protein
MQEVLTISTEEELEEILRNTDENCTIIIVDENCNVQHDYTETNYNITNTVSEKNISVGETITYTASPVSNENHQVRDNKMEMIIQKMVGVGKGKDNQITGNRT